MRSRPQQQEAVEKGLAWLARTAGGRWQFGGEAAAQRTPASPRSPASPSCRRATSPAAASTATTSSSASITSSPVCQESGLIASDKSQGPMYGHGFATLFLGEVYGMTGDEQREGKAPEGRPADPEDPEPRGRLALPARAVRRRHLRHDLPGHGACAARDAGIKVEKDVDRQGDRVRPRLPEPRRRIQLHGRAGRRRRQRLRPIGRGRRGALLRRRLRGRRPRARPEVPHAVHAPAQRRGSPESKATTSTATTTPCQAMFLAGGDYWAKWYPAIRDQLIAHRTSHRRTGTATSPKTTPPRWR